MILFSFAFGYITLLIELIFFHVPSVANTKNFFTKNSTIQSTKSKFIQRINRWSTTKKIVLLLLPTVFINLYFFVPFLYFLPNSENFQFLKSSYGCNS